MKRAAFVFAIYSFMYVAPAAAEPLSWYRSELGDLDAEASRAASESRLLELRNQLGTSGSDLELLRADGTPIEYPSLKVREKRKFSSSYFKEVLSRVSDRLRDEHLAGVPKIHVGLGTQRSHLEAQQADRDLIIAEEIGDFDDFVQELSVLVDAEKDRSETPQEETGFENSLKAALKLHASQGSAEGSLKSAFSKLGELERVEVYDYRIVRLIFASDSLPEAQIALSLSMLISYRIDEDDFFLDVLRYVTEELVKQAEYLEYERDENGEWVMTKRPTLYPVWKKFTPERKQKKLSDLEQQKLDRMKEVLAWVQAKFEGAKLANTLLKSLKPREVNLLLDLFLQISAFEIVSQEEVAAITNYAMGESDAVYALQDQMSQKFKSSEEITENEMKGLREAQARIDRINLDAASFLQLSRELLSLENYLAREEQAIKTHQDRMTDLKDGRSWK